MQQVDAVPLTLRGKRAIGTSASRGIGAGIAKELAHLGSNASQDMRREMVRLS